MRSRTFTRSKAKWDEEVKALQDVCKKSKISAENLKSEHTEENFVWKTIKTESSPVQNVDDSSVAEFAKAKFSEKEAVEAAMAKFDTFEGNLNPDHTETHYRFTKVR